MARAAELAASNIMRVTSVSPSFSPCARGFAPTCTRRRASVSPVAFAVCVFLLLPTVTLGQQASPKGSRPTEAKRVLILMEEDVTWPAFRLIYENLQAELRGGAPEGIITFAEHLDLAHFASPELRAAQGSLVQQKYANSELDLVIAVGNVPLNLFPQVPLLSLSADPSHKPTDVPRTSNIAGSLWINLDGQGTLEVARRLQPGARRIFVIGDGAKGSGSSVLNQLQTTYPASAGGIPVTYLTGPSVAAICEQLAALKTESIVIYTALSKDEHGHPLIPGKVVAEIAAKSAAPVYVVTDSMIGTGAVGGYVTSFAKIGEVGGQMALYVLDGGRGQDLTVPNVYIFDWRQLRRWKIAESALPAESVVLDRQPNAWELYKYYIIAAVLLLAAQLFLIVGMLQQKSRRKRTERSLMVSNAELTRSGAALLETEERFRRMADSAPVLMWMAGTDKQCTFVNQTWLDFTGRPTELELGSGWVDGVHPQDVENCVKTFADAFAARKDFRMEYRLRHRDGDYRWLVDIGVPRIGSGGTFMGYIGSCVDITERKSSEKSLEELSGRLIAGQEAERTRIARDLHDDFSQRLALLSIGLGRLWKKRPESEEEQRLLTRALWEQTKEISSDVHRLSHQLHSSKLEHVGLAPTLRGLCGELAEKYVIRLEFSEQGAATEMPKDVSLCLFRIAQEALSNVVKYSEATRAEVELRHAADETQLRITDTGVGFDPALRMADAGIGLVSMRERLRLVGGTFSVRSAPGAGTEILATVPLAVAAIPIQVRAQTSGG